MRTTLNDATRTWRKLLLAGLLLAGTTGCDSLLEVELPGKVAAEKLDDPGLAGTLVASVIGDFECAYNNYTFGTAVHSDEMWHSSGNLVMRSWGQRRVTADFPNYVTGSCGGWGYGLWMPLHIARVQAETAFERISGFDETEVEDRALKLATVALYGGYTYTLFGEGFCRVTLDGGPPIDPEDVLRIADERFTTAIELAQQADDQEVLNAAYLGRARTRLDRGQWAQAMADARQVTEGFELLASRSSASSRLLNKGHNNFNIGGHSTVAPAFRNLEWKGVPDPRVEVVNTGRQGFDNITDLWISTKWPELGTSIEIATWEEAQLIIAEAAVRTGDPDTAVDIINDLHTRAGLPAFDPGTDGDVLDHVIQERSRELFQEGGHRLNDMLRLDLPFFSGTDHVGQQYGETTCFPVPLVELG